MGYAEINLAHYLRQGEYGVMDVPPLDIKSGTGKICVALQVLAPTERGGAVTEDTERARHLFALSHPP